MAGGEQRNDGRVRFERGIPAFMMAIDGTWRRNCIMEDVSEVGAKLTVEGSVEGLHLKEIAKRLAQENGWPAREVYRLGL